MTENDAEQPEGHPKEEMEDVIQSEMEVADDQEAPTLSRADVAAVRTIIRRLSSGLPPRNRASRPLSDHGSVANKNHFDDELSQVSDIQEGPPVFVEANRLSTIESEDPPAAFGLRKRSVSTMNSQYSFAVKSTNRKHSTRTHSSTPRHVHVPQSLPVQEGGDSFEVTTLTQDSFSFLITAPVWSVPFFTGLFVFLFKNTIYILLSLDLVNPSSPNANYLNVPVAVTSAVLVSQVVSFVIAVYTQNDLIASLMMIYEGFDKDEIGSAFEGSGYSKWLLALIFLFCDGSLGLAVTFVLIVTSSTVLDVLLNFAAVEFVSSIDEAAFFLAGLGFLGPRNKLEATRVTDTEFRVKRKHTPIFQISLLFGILLLILAFWGLVSYKQFTGAFSIRTILVQFDDSIRPELGPYSGLYDMVVRTARPATERFWFVEEGAKLGTFGYCGRSRTWTLFTVPSEDACENPIAESSVSTSFDISTTGSEAWYAVTDSGYPVVLDFALLIPVCETSVDCGDRGPCIRNRCECPDAYFGFRCEYVKAETCPTLEIDPRSGVSFGASRNLASTYHRLDTPNGKFVEVYGRPVFIDDNNRDVLLFMGLRWAITDIDNFIGFDPSEISLGDYLTLPSFHPLTGILRADLLSQPMHFYTATDNDIPVGLDWFVPDGDGLNETIIDTMDGATLICAVCNNQTNRCFHKNPCLGTGVCNCQNGEGGSLCEVRPLANGHCDSFFNLARYSYDGGDCCSTTCMDNAFECGVTTVEPFTTVDIGFSNCVDQGVVGWCVAGEACFIQNSKVVVPSVPSGTHIVYLSPNGRILVVAEPLLNSVRVFDKSANRWVQRGQTLHGALMSDYGKNLAIASPVPFVVRRVNAEVPIILALFDSLRGAIDLARWSTLRRIWVVDDVIDLSARGLLLTCRQQRNAFGTCNEFDFIEVSLELSGNPVVLTHLLPPFLNSSVCGDTFVFSGDGQGQWQLSNFGFTSLESLSDNSGVIAVYNETMSIVTVMDAKMYAVLSEFDPFASIAAPEGPRSVVGIKLNRDGSVVNIAGNVDGFGFFVSYLVCANPFGTPVALLEGLQSFGGQNNNVLAFSSDGRSVARNNGTVIEAFIQNRVRGTWDPRGSVKSVSIDNPFDNLGYPFSLSADGSVVATLQGRDATVFELNQKCVNDNTTLFRFVVTLASGSSQLSWRMASLVNINGMLFTRRILGRCNDCYAGAYAIDDTIASSPRTITVQQLCVPPLFSSCMQLNVSLVEAQNDVGFVAYHFNESEPGSRRPVAMESDPRVLQEGSSSMLGGCPPLEPIRCEADESILIIGMTLDNARLVRWEIRSSSGALLVDREATFADPSTNLVQHCVPTSECLAFSISNVVQASCVTQRSGGLFVLRDGNLVLDEAVAVGSSFNLGPC